LARVIFFHYIGYIQLLLASFAFTNKFPLVYIPQCALWARKYNSTFGKDNKIKNSAEYFLKNFLLFNSDIINLDLKKNIIMAINGKVDILEVYDYIINLKGLVILI
jgi:hypothetical protein